MLFLLFAAGGVKGNAVPIVGPSGEIREIEELPPSSRRQATVHRTVAFNCSNLFRQKKKAGIAKAIPAFLVRVGRFELPAS